MTEKDFNEMSNNVRQVLELLKGEGMHKNNGVIDRQSRIEKRVSVLERIVWLAAGAFAVIQLIVKVVDYDSLFK